MANGNINFINIAVIISDLLFFGVAAFLIYTVKQQFKHQKRQPMLWFIAYWFVSSSIYGIFVLLDNTSHAMSLLVSSSLLQLIPYLFIISIFELYNRSIPQRLYIICVLHVVGFTMINTSVHLFSDIHSYANGIVTYFSIMSVFLYAAYRIYIESSIKKLGDKILFLSVLLSVAMSLVALIADFILQSYLDDIIMVVLIKNIIFCMQLVAIIARFFFHEIEWHHERSIRDKLTGLYNRRYFEEQAKSFLKNNNSHCYLAVLDIDHFKPINDKYGHLNGDVVLETIAELLLTFFSKDLVARYGGEEFVILLREQSESDVKKKLTKFRKTIAMYPFSVADDIVKVTVSIGVSRLEKENELRTSFSRADKALYDAKFSGRNQLVTT